MPVNAHNAGNITHRGIRLARIAPVTRYFRFIEATSFKTEFPFCGISAIDALYHII